MTDLTVRVYGPLNDFLPAHRRQLSWRRLINGHTSVKDLHPHAQFVEVLRRFGPLNVLPFSRCLRCNDVLREVPKSAVDQALLPRTRKHYDAFEICSGCGRVYWKGSHWKRLKQAIDAAREESERSAT